MLQLTQLIGFGAASGAITVGKVIAGSGAYVLVGTTAGVVRISPTHKVLPAAASSYSLTGTAAGVSKPVSPAALTGLVGWWDTSVTSSLTLSGTNVTAFASQTGISNTTLSNYNNVPYSATAFNTSYPGLNYVNGNAGTLEVASFPMGTGNTLTAFYVGTMASAASSAAGRVMSYAKNISSNDFDNAGSWTVSNGTPLTTSVLLTRNSLNTQLAGISASPAGHRVIVTIDSSGVMTVYVDGVASSTATSSGNWVSGGYFDLGRQARTASDYWYGVIAEAGVATGFTNATGVAGLDAYLKAKWGL